MKKILIGMLSLVAIIMLIILFIGISFLSETGRIAWRGHFAPKRATVERDIFIQTRSFNEAKMQELVKYRLEYMRSDDPAEKTAIASTIRMAFADYDTSKLPHELKLFIEEIKYK